MKLTLVRHGETVGQSSVRYYGATDVALNDLGIAQMRRVGAALLAERFQVTYTSELQRTTVAAGIIAPAVPRQALAGFNEIHFGSWEGLTREEIAERDPENYAVWQERMHDFVYPGGDAVGAFRARVAAAFTDLLPRLPNDSLFVVHRGIIGTIVSQVLCFDSTQRAMYPIDLGSIHVLTNDENGGWRSRVVNRLDHLDGLA